MGPQETLGGDADPRLGRRGDLRGHRGLPGSEQMVLTGPKKGPSRAERANRRKSTDPRAGSKYRAQDTDKPASSCCPRLPHRLRTRRLSSDTSRSLLTQIAGRMTHRMIWFSSLTTGCGHPGNTPARRSCTPTHTCSRPAGSPGWPSLWLFQDGWPHSQDLPGPSHTEHVGPRDARSKQGGGGAQLHLRVLVMRSDGPRQAALQALAGEIQSEGSRRVPRTVGSQLRCSQRGPVSRRHFLFCKMRRLAT